MTFPDPAGVATSGSDRNPDPDELWRLSPGEREIFELLARGLSYAEIAEARGVSESTVRSQAYRIRQKPTGGRSWGVPSKRPSYERWPAGSFMAEFPEPGRNSLLAAGNLYRFDDEQLMFVQGDVGDFVYVLTSGLVKLTVTAENGAATTIAIRSRGDLEGEDSVLDHGPRVATARAIGPVTAVRITGSAFTEITSRSRAAQETVTRSVLAKMRAAIAQCAADRVWESKERITQVLYQLAERHAEPDPDGLIRLPITHSDLGDLAGVAVSTAERVLKELRKQGVVTTRYREITIKDMSYLSSIRFGEGF